MFVVFNSSLVYVNELCITTKITCLAANMIVYLIINFNITSIEATRIVNISDRGNDLSPLVGAFLGDAYLGHFWAISIGSLLSFLVSSPYYNYMVMSSYFL